VFTPVFGGVRVAHLFSFLCCMCLFLCLFCFCCLLLLSCVSNVADVSGLSIRNCNPLCFPLTFISKLEVSILSLSVILQLEFGTILTVCSFHFINLFIKIVVTWTLKIIKLQNCVALEYKLFSRFKSLIFFLSIFIFVKILKIIQN